MNAVTSASEKSSIKNLMKEKGIDLHSIAPLIALFFVMLVFTVTTDNFLTARNILNVVRQVSVMGTMAIGITFVLITGEIDLSIANVMALSGVVAGAFSLGAYGLDSPYPVVISILIGLLVGVVLGTISGLANAIIGIPSFMATLAVSYVADGLMLSFSGARPLYGLPDAMLWFGAGTIGTFPVIILIFLVIFTVSHIVLSKTVFGKTLYAIGGNVEAARMSGINVKKYKILVLTISGLLCAIAGIMMLGRVGSVQVTVGQGLMLQPIAAVILGGTSMFGGEGSLVRTLIGVLIMGFLVNGLNILGIDAAGQRIAIGVILFIAIGFNVMGKAK